MAPLLSSRLRAAGFLAGMGALTVGAAALAATRSVPLKMLPFDNKNEILLVLDTDEGTTLERTSAAVQEFEAFLAKVPEVTDFTSYVGVPGPSTSMDWSVITISGRDRTVPRCASISSARSTARSRVPASACGCAMS